MDNEDKHSSLSSAESLILSSLMTIAGSIVGVLIIELAPEDAREWYSILLLYVLGVIIIVMLLVFVRSRAFNALSTPTKNWLNGIGAIPLFILPYTTPFVLGYDGIIPFIFLIIVISVMFVFYSGLWYLFLGVFYSDSSENLGILCLLVTSVAYFLGTVTLLVPLLFTSSP